jgi:hypothetical protein
VRKYRSRGKKKPIGRTTKRRRNSRTPVKSTTTLISSPTEHPTPTPPQPPANVPNSTQVIPANISIATPNATQHPIDPNPTNNNQNITTKIKTWRQQEKMRISISFLFENLYYLPYLKGDIELSNCNKDKGVIASVSKRLGLDRTHYTTVKTVIQDTIIALKLGEEYEPSRSRYICPNRRKVDPDSFDMHYLTCLKSIGGSFTLTTAIYNLLYRTPNDLPPIKCKAVHNSIKNSNHKLVFTSKVHQASNRNLGWKQARFNSCLQLLVRFGLPVPADTSGAVVSDAAHVERTKIIENNLTLSIYQIGWWDEKHIQQVVGDIRDSSYQFGYNEHGIYDPDVEVDVKKRVSSCFDSKLTIEILKIEY